MTKRHKWIVYFSPFVKILMKLPQRSTWTSCEILQILVNRSSIRGYPFALRESRTTLFGSRCCYVCGTTLSMSADILLQIPLIVRRYLPSIHFILDCREFSESQCYSLQTKVPRRYVELKLPLLGRGLLKNEQKWILNVR